MKSILFLSRLATCSLLLGALLGACDGGGMDSTAEPGEHRFTGMTEAEMFESVRTFYCSDLLARCFPEESAEDCADALSDDSSYRDPIDEETRVALDGCLTALDAASCEIALGDDASATVPECQNLGAFLDIK